MDTTLTQAALSNFPSPSTDDPTRSQVVLSEPQRMAMEWLMGGGSITEAAQYAGVTRQTVSGWMHHDKEFRELFQKWQLQVRTMNHARLIALSESALETVAVAIREKSDARVALVVLKSLGMLGDA